MPETGYRQAQRRCPSCGELLSEQLQGGVHVDVCPDCSGIWLDWMDGDIEGVSAQLSVPAGRADPAGGDACCPVCATALDEDKIGAVLIWRCGSCAGAWLPHASLKALQQGLGADPGSPPDDPLLTRILDALGRLILPGR